RYRARPGRRRLGGRPASWNGGLSMSTQLLPPNYQPPPPADSNTRRLGPLGRFARRRYMLFHLGFTLRLIGRCLADPRVSAGSKALFLGITGFVLLLVLMPEVGADVIAGVVPFFGW